ncbi:unnamed protein product, partial [Rotaria sordida]
KVYRRDNPKMKRGRYREFYQCDFDIAGDFDPMVPDAECIKIVVEILDKLDLGQYKIYTPWHVVRNEMINEKGLTPEVADKIWSYVQMHGNVDSIDKLRTDVQLMAVKSANEENLAGEALDGLKVLFRYLTLYGIMDKIIFDLKLARGLDYYTGVIFEAVLTKYQYDPQLGDDQVAVGSVAGGGRYDGLVCKIDPRKRSVPCIGASIGVERIFAIKEHQMIESQIQTKTIETEVYVASAQKNLIEERMKLCSYLWANDFKAEMALKRNPRLLDQLQYCEKNQIELCVIIGSAELEAGIVKIRDVETREEFEIPRAQLVEQLRVHLTRVRQRIQES